MLCARHHRFLTLSVAWRRCSGAIFTASGSKHCSSLPVDPDTAHDSAVSTDSGAPDSTRHANSTRSGVVWRQASPPVDNWGVRLDATRQKHQQQKQQRPPHSAGAQRSRGYAAQSSASYGRLMSDWLDHVDDGQDQTTDDARYPADRRSSFETDTNRRRHEVDPTDYDFDQDVERPRTQSPAWHGRHSHSEPSHSRPHTSAFTDVGEESRRGDYYDNDGQDYMQSSDRSREYRPQRHDFRQQQQRQQRRSLDDNLFAARSLHSRGVNEARSVAAERGVLAGSTARMLTGVHSVTMAVRAALRHVHCVYFRPPASDRVARLLDECRARHVPIQPVAPAELHALTARLRRHQNVCALVGDRPLAQHDSLFKLMVDGVNVKPPMLTESAMEQRQPRVWVLLDRVHDPMNVGSIVRSCCFLGAERVIVSAEKSCRLSGTVSRASSGAVETFPMHRLPSQAYDQLLSELRLNGWRLLAACSAADSQASDDGANDADVQDEPDDIGDTGSSECSTLQPTEHTGDSAAVGVEADVSISQLAPDCNTLLVIGNEGDGVDPALLQHCRRVTVPSGRVLPAGIDSLNVGVATALVLSRLLVSPT